MPRPNLNVTATNVCFSNLKGSYNRLVVFRCNVFPNFLKHLEHLIKMDNGAI